MQTRLIKTSNGVKASSKTTDSLRRKHTRHGEYFFDTENKEPDDPRAPTGLMYSLYEMAAQAEEGRIFEGGNNSLAFIEQEIKIHTKITSIEVFKIGELLARAKKLCQQENKGFKEWIAETCDYSYELANKQMNVFYNCLGWRGFATDIPISILYRMGAPSFDDELREFLFTKGKITTISEFQGLVKRYKEGGIDAIRNEVEELNRSSYIHRQTQYTFDQCKNCLIILEGAVEAIQNRASAWPVEFKDRIESFEPEARAINEKLHTCLKNIVNLLTTTVEDSKADFHEYIESVKMKIESVKFTEM